LILHASTFNTQFKGWLSSSLIPSQGQDYTKDRELSVCQYDNECPRTESTIYQVTKYPTAVPVVSSATVRDCSRKSFTIAEKLAVLCRVFYRSSIADVIQIRLKELVRQSRTGLFCCAMFIPLIFSTSLPPIYFARRVDG
jgi:hypothetical protein